MRFSSQNAPALSGRRVPVERGATLRISEIYRSIQGESSWAGLPCTFVRLTGCDLRCLWCDTEYAFTGGETLSVSDIVERVDAEGASLVEVTGGEPLLQENVHGLLAALCDAGHTVLLETGGHRDISSVDRRVRRIVDVKCPASGEARRNRLANLDLLRSTDEVKFVLADRPDYEWARDLVQERLTPAPCPILFSVVHGVLEPARAVSWIQQDGLPVRFQIQLHKYIWPSRDRGV